jgi:hypothetical protein
MLLAVDCLGDAFTSLSDSDGVSAALLPFEETKFFQNENVGFSCKFPFLSWYTLSANSNVKLMSL